MPLPPFPWKRKMNWNAIAAIGEVAGAAGVIISLVYLAVQVRHGAKAARRAAAHDVMTTTTPVLTALVSRSEITSIWMRGLSDFESLDPEERVRFSCLMLLLTYSWDETQHGYNDDQLDEWAMERFMGSMQELARLPGFKSWYEIRKDWLSKEIRVTLEREMGDDVTSPLYESPGEKASTRPPASG